MVHKQNRKGGPHGAVHRQDGGIRISAPLALAVAVVVSIVYFSVVPLFGNIFGASQNGTAEQQNGTPYTQLVNGIMMNLSRQGRLDISYAGNIIADYPGYGSAASTHIDMPIYVEYERYGGSSRLTVNYSSPLLGNVSTIDLFLANGTSYSCASLTGDIGNVLYGGAVQSNTAGALEGRGYRCQTVANASTLDGQAGIAEAFHGLNFTEISKSAYYSVPCTLFYGNSSKSNAQSEIAAKYGQTLFYSLSGCVSDDGRSIPLNLTLLILQRDNFTPSVTLNLTIHEISISNATTWSRVASLPGPIENISLTNSIEVVQNGTRGCNAVRNFTCSSVNFSPDGTLSMRINNIGARTLYNLKFACNIGGQSTLLMYEGVYTNGSASLLAPGTVLWGGSAINVRNLLCQKVIGGLSNYTVGTFSINYTEGSGRPSAANPYISYPVAAFYDRTTSPQ